MALNLKIVVSALALTFGLVACSKNEEPKPMKNPIVIHEDMQATTVDPGAELLATKEHYFGSDSAVEANNTQQQSEVVVVSEDKKAVDPSAELLATKEHYFGSEKTDKTDK